MNQEYSLRHLPMRAISILASCLMLLSCAVPQLRAQTSIVAVMTPESIVIGADSKETTPDGSMGGSFCKIGTTDGVF